MKTMEEYDRVRALHLTGGLSFREIGRGSGFHRSTVKKMIDESAPLDYQRREPPKEPVLGPFNRDHTSGLEVGGRVGEYLGSGRPPKRDARACLGGGEGDASQCCGGCTNRISARRRAPVLAVHVAKRGFIRERRPSRRPRLPLAKPTFKAP